ncbi:MAG: ATP-dependent Clp protease ATP-binding subunit [Candidatus Vogelbacteria bacterium]|nr:ATP-dependent Clp protease ATP-binding subunit [Candidatus Vogelbacteria bacterium]
MENLEYKTINLIESVVSHKARHRLIKLTSVLSIVTIFGIALARLFEEINFLEVHLIGLMLILFAVWLLIFTLECMHRSLTSRVDIGSIYVYDVLSSAEYESGSYLKAFVNSKLGQIFIIRAECAEGDLKNAIESASAMNEEAVSEVSPTLENFVTWMYDSHPQFSKLLSKSRVMKNDAIAIAKWINFELTKGNKSERWWSPESLMLHSSLGKRWNYGRTPALDRYSRDLSDYPHEKYEPILELVYERQIKQLQIALSKPEFDSAILVSSPEYGGDEVAAVLAEIIRSGRTTPELSHKRPVYFHGGVFATSFTDLNIFGQELNTVFTEAVLAGNTVMIIEDFGALADTAKRTGLELGALLEPYLEGGLQVLALTDQKSYRNTIETDKGMLKFFEVIQLEELDNEKTKVILEKVANDYESRSEVIFSYPSLERIADIASRYVVEGVMPKKAITLLGEISGYAKGKMDMFITHATVDEYARQKFNLPIGKITTEERGDLLSLSNRISERVLGQSEAVKAVTTDMERLRVDVRNPKRPVASFLFIGPTGVGKTEMAKVLSLVHYGSEDALERLDMTEYQSDDALDKLIGSFANDKPGVLTSLLREHPYCVLLLDEFEKCAESVKDLFLQILDEGMFADMDGNKVNARNIIFIATSNAVSDLIFKLQEQHVNLDLKKELLISTIVERGILKPELINRFDSVVVFHPLQGGTVDKIAKLQLQKLAKRLFERGIQFEITDALVSDVVVNGFDKEFGARPMQRYIQDHVEADIAKKMIRGELGSGDSLSM